MRLRNTLVLDCLEQTKEAGLVPVYLKVKLVANCSDAPDYFTAAPCKKQFYRCVLMKWMLCGIDQLTHIATKRRNPVRIVAIQPERQLYEFFSIAIRSDRLEAKRTL